jgi:hypothetical protein
LFNAADRFCANTARIRRQIGGEFEQSDVSNFSRMNRKLSLLAKRSNLASLAHAQAAEIASLRKQ